MLLSILRVTFVVLAATVAMNIAEYVFPANAMAVLLIVLGIAALLIALDVFIPQKSLLAISGLFFGLLVGMFVTYVIGLVLNLVLVSYHVSLLETLKLNNQQLTELVSALHVLIGVVCCYLAVSFILQTKDDIRFVIPYVEFAKQRKGEHPLILDTSVIIDGRITDVFSTWPVDAPVIIPRFVLNELQTIADSSEKLKRNRGRRGLDIVNKLQNLGNIDIQFQDFKQVTDDADNVDQRLVALAQKVDGRLVTNDYNLNKVAQIRGVEVININDLANAMKAVFLPGEFLQVKIIKPGEEAGQGIGYLDDGTMVVVELARDRIGETVNITVTSALQTSAGRMVFGRLKDMPAGPDRHRRRPG